MNHKRVKLQVKLLIALKIISRIFMYGLGITAILTTVIGGIVLLTIFTKGWIWIPVLIFVIGIITLVIRDDHADYSLLDEILEYDLNSDNEVDPNDTKQTDVD